MSSTPARIAELQDLLDRLQDDDITEQDRRRLNELLRADAEARRYFISYLDVHSWLAWDGGHAMDGAPTRGEGGTRTAEAGPAEAEDLRPKTRDLRPIVPPSPVVSLLSVRISSLVSYAIALLLVGGGLLATWTWSAAELPCGLAKAPAKPAVPAAKSRTVLSVGRITRMTGFQWADPHVAEYASYVPLGSKYVVPGGSLEISYYGGAKIVIEGPAEYEIESGSIGSLHYGKATVQMSQKPLIAMPARTEALKRSEPGSLRIFSIRLPEAMVRSQDAQFNVVVDRLGISRTCVARGKVKLGLPILPPDQVIPLGESEWAWVDPKGDHAGSVICGSDKGPTQVYSHQLPQGAPVYSKEKKRKSSSLPEKRETFHSPDS
jgi:hypothetical protein